jgi:hypothetical protein
MYLLPKTVSEKLDKQRRTFFWQGGSTKKSIGWLNGQQFVQAKERGTWDQEHKKEEYKSPLQMVVEARE